MRKLSILLIVLFTVNPVFAQSDKPCVPCLPQGINFNTQSQIDSFPINHPNCTQIEGDVLIGAYNSTDITNLDSLSVLTSIGGYLMVIDNDALTSLTGLDNVTSIGQSLGIQSNDGLTSLSSLDNVTSIGEHLYVEGNSALTGLAGLDNVTSIGGTITIRSNAALTSIKGLENVTGIGGGLTIGINNALTSLIGLEKIDAGSIEYLYIYENASLVTCEVKSVCGYLASPSGNIIIYDNANGCNSQAEVETACDTLSVENLTNDGIFTIYPNPADDKMTIETAGKGHISILNLGGKNIITRLITEALTQIDINTLPSGVYFVRLTGERTVQGGKFVKQ